MGSRAVILALLAGLLSGCMAVTPSCLYGMATYSDNNIIRWADPLGSIDVAVSVTMTCFQPAKT